MTIKDGIHKKMGKRWKVMEGCPENASLVSWRLSCFQEVCDFLTRMCHGRRKQYHNLTNPRSFSVKHKTNRGWKNGRHQHKQQQQQKFMAKWKVFGAEPPPALNSLIQLFSPLSSSTSFSSSAAFLHARWFSVQDSLASLVGVFRFFSGLLNLRLLRIIML